MRDRLFIKEAWRESIDNWKSRKLLGIDALEAKDLFLLAVSFGLDKPEDIQGKRDGYVRTSYVKTVYEKALFASILLGKSENADSIDKYANDDINFDESERCAEAGFKALQELFVEADNDPVLLEKIALERLRILFQKNVASKLSLSR